MLFFLSCQNFLMPVKIITIVGARPQFIKAAAFSRWARNQACGGIVEKIIHTGQHYDENMSEVFFRELDIPAPEFQLELKGSSHGHMTAGMLIGIEDILTDEKPDCLLVYGDTNSTLAGALAAVKIHIPVAHVEAGLRSYNRNMPEEINRVLSDQISTRLYCPTDNAIQNLAREGIIDGIVNVGDILYDVALHYRDIAMQNSDIFSRMNLEKKRYFLSTIHRAENTDDKIRMSAICSALGEIAETAPVIMPLHPRTRKILAREGLDAALGKVNVVDPLPFLDMVRLQIDARTILTDSGGLQKEAYFHQVPCVTIRDQTEWVETVETGWNCLVNPEAGMISETAIKATAPDKIHKELYGNGNTAELIYDDLITTFGAS